MELSKFKKDSSFQRIKASYLDESSVELTEREAEKKKRMSHAWSLRLNNKYSTYQVIQILMRDHGISQASAYREYNMSMQIFGELDATTLAAERQVLKEGGETVDDEVVRAVQDVLHGAFAAAVLLEALVEFVFEALQRGGAVVFAGGDAGKRGADGAAAV